MGKKITIIGAGIAGLSAGCYARMNGYEAEIYEAYSQSGGLCTAWKRGEYTFDGCLHWLTGSGAKNDFYPIWQELGALKDRHIHDPDCFYRTLTGDGKLISFYSDADRLQEHLIDFAPEDETAIREFCSWVKKLSHMKMPMDKPFALFNFFDIAKLVISMLPYGKMFGILTNQSIGEYARNFKNRDLRSAFENLLMNKDAQLIAAVITLSMLHVKAGGFPIGGSLEFALAIEKRFLDLGGKIHFKQKVDKILVENGHAKGIELQDGQKIDSDYVISTCDLNFTLNRLLDGKYNKPIHDLLFNQTKTYSTSVQVSLGLDMIFSERENCVGLHLPVMHPFSIAGESVSQVSIRQYGMDPTLAPAGKTSFVVFYMTDKYEYWQKLYEDKPGYKAVKKQILEDTLKNLEHYYPGISSRVEVSDVATPVTYARYANVWRGKYMTWVATKENQNELRTIPLAFEELGGFYMAGMWTMAPGGVPSAAKSARDVLQLICHKEKVKFRTNRLV